MPLAQVQKKSFGGLAKWPLGQKGKWQVKIYIAGPYTLGGQARNVRAQIDVANRLAEMGQEPFAPLLNHFWGIVYPHDKEFWMKMDLKWVGVCDGLIRLPGESEGADREVAEARRLGIPVIEFKHISPPGSVLLRMINKIQRVCEEKLTKEVKADDRQS